MSRPHTTASGRRFYTVPGHGSTVLLPRHTYTTDRYFLSVAACTGNDRFALPAEDFLLDSGSDLCVVDRAYATAHGFELSDGDPHTVQGIGPACPGVVVYRHVRFPDFQDHPARLAFWVPDDAALGPLRLLSLAAVLAHFAIVFHTGRADFYPPP